MTATAVMGLASCSNDNDPAGGQEVPQGKATGMQLVLDLGSAATRAIADPNADTKETTIENLNVFIYGANGIFEKEYTIPFDDLTAGADNTWTTDELEATTGAKTIYVGANMTQNMIGIMKSTSVNGLAGKGVNEPVADITTDNKFVMFSTVGATPVLEEEDEDAPGVIPTANQVKVNIQRLAAKIAVGMTAQLSADDGTQQGAAGTIDGLGFVVDNINKMYYLTYGGAAADAKDANMNVDQYKEADFEIKSYYDDQNQPVANQYGAITPGTADKAKWAIDYASENLTKDKMIKGVTRIVVKGRFTPKAGVKVTDDGQGNITFAEEDGLIQADETYHLLDFPEAGGYAFFPEATTDDQLKAFMAQKKGVKVDGITAEMLKAAKKTYINGLNYWWVTVKENQGDVLRNHYYQVNVTSIWAPGRADGEFNPDKDDNQIDKETNITVEVTVEPWNLVPFDADLRP